MISSDRTRIALVAGLMSAAGFGLAGCMASPTYGTDKTANQQLLEDVTGVLSLGPQRGPHIDYKPRPELVEPETTAVLPPPQDDVTTASNSAWPESPEERLARVRQEATENRDKPGYRPNVVYDASTQEGPRVVPVMTDQEKRAEFKRRLAESRQGNPNSRKYLSEPPVEYRQPAASAPIDDLGEPEWKKDRKARRQSRDVASPVSGNRFE